MSSTWQKEKQDVADAARRMAELGLVAGTAGNVSVRVDPLGDRDLMAITPSGVAYEGMCASDIVVTDFEIEPVEGDLTPSSESLLHAGIYAARPDVRAVVHTHSVYSTVLAVAGLDLPPVIDEVVVYVGGTVRVSDYAFPGTKELSLNVCEALGSNKAAFISNHGAVAVGGSVFEALDVSLLIERASQVYVLARTLGPVRDIPEECVAAEAAIYRMRNPQIGET